MPPRTACKPVAPRGHALGCTQLDADEPARSPVFCGNFLVKRLLADTVPLGHHRYRLAIRLARLKQLEIENARLKKLVAERDLEIEVRLPGE